MIRLVKPCQFWRFLYQEDCISILCQYHEFTLYLTGRSYLDKIDELKNSFGDSVAGFNDILNGGKIIIVSAIT